MSELLFSNVAERGVLSGVLHDPVERFDLVLEQVPEGAFYFDQNAAAFEVLQDMRETRRPIEPRSFVMRAADLGKLVTIGGEQSVNELVAHRPTNLHFAHYLQTVKEKAVMRQVSAYGNWVLEQVQTPGTDPAEMVELMQVKALGISLDRSSAGPRHIDEVLAEIDIANAAAILRAEAGQKICGLQTGLARLDQELQGIERGDRYGIIGLSNTGKTARLMQALKHLVIQGERPLVFMCDGKDREAIVRLYAELADVELSWITGGGFKGEDRTVKLARLKEARAWLKRQGIFIYDGAFHIQEQNSIARRFKKKHGITGTATDFFGRCTSVGFGPKEKIAMLASVADEWSRGIDVLGIWGIMLAQANQNDFGVGDPIEKGPAALKDCKTLYDVLTKAEGWSREQRAFEVLVKEETRILDSDRAGALPLEDHEQFLLCSIIKSKNTGLGDVWARLLGSVMRMKDFYPHAQIADARSPALGRLMKQVESGKPNYASRDYQGPRGRPRKDGGAPPPEDDFPESAPPRPDPGPSVQMTITRPNRPNAIGEARADNAAPLPPTTL